MALDSSVYQIALTGGTGAGKSSAAVHFQRLGAVVVDADKIAREVVAPHSEGLADIVDYFGAIVLNPDGSLNRQKLADIVFNDSDKLMVLNSITHPRIAFRTKELFGAVDDGVIVHDIPLFSPTSSNVYDLVVVIEAPLDMRLNRLTSSRGMTLEDAKARISSQETDEQRRGYADIILVNDGSEVDLARQIEDLWAQKISPAL